MEFQNLAHEGLQRLNRHCCHHCHQIVTEYQPALVVSAQMNINFSH